MLNELQESGLGDASEQQKSRLGDGTNMLEEDVSMISVYVGKK